ncbi:hypothetical protein EV361DRAFT_869194 [Lentinula raphanica]|nr:hypothetical protein EV361DRAFT_869194 [Lentinula raphanica]
MGGISGHNRHFQVNLSNENTIVNVFTYGGCMMMFREAYLLSFMRDDLCTTPSPSREVWDFRKNSQRFRPFFLGYLAAAKDRMIDIGFSDFTASQQGMRYYTMYELGWTSNSQSDFNNIFHMQLNALADMFPNRSYDVCNGNVLCQIIPWNTPECCWQIKYLPASKLINEVNKVDELFTDNGPSLIHSCNDGKQTLSRTTAFHSSLFNSALVMKGELRQIDHEDYMIGFREIVYCIVAHEIYVVY